MKLIHFHSRKCIWKCSLRNGVHFVSASMCLAWISDNIPWTFGVITAILASNYTNIIFLLVMRLQQLLCLLHKNACILGSECVFKRYVFESCEGIHFISCIKICYWSYLTFHSSRYDRTAWIMHAVLSTEDKLHSRFSTPSQNLLETLWPLCTNVMGNTICYFLWFLVIWIL